MAKLYTRTGDKGTTGLLYGGRVPKTDPRVEAYGTVDEANSILGLARSLSKDPRNQELLLNIQRELFTVGAELATDNESYSVFLGHFKPTTNEMVQRFEQIIDEMDQVVRLPQSFIIPGASSASAALDMARTVLRRAERQVTALYNERNLVNPNILSYLNRLADLIFMLARYEDRELPFEILTGGRIDQP